MLQVKFSRRARGLAFGLAVLAGSILLMFGTFISPGYLSRPAYDNFLVIALIVALVPPSAVDFLDRRWRSALESKIPDLVRDIAESQKTGMTFTRSIEHASRLNMGPLSVEMKKTVVALGYGVPYHEALDDLAERAGVPLMYRTVTLLKEVGRSGGKLYELLDDVYNHIREVQDLERDRKRQMGPYTGVIYATFGVFVIVAIILFQTFFAEIKKIIASGSPFGANINPELYYIWFFNMTVIEALIAGLVAGKMTAGAAAAGLKHMLILMAISVVVFMFVIAPSVGI